MVTRHKTPVRVSPDAVPQPHPAVPLRDRTVASPRQFASVGPGSGEDVGAGTGEGVVGCVGESGVSRPLQAVAARATSRVPRRTTRMRTPGSNAIGFAS
jgi:hypothetical protein